MTACKIHPAAQAAPRKAVSVNGVTIAHAAIAAEAQNHPAASPAQAFAEAARALAIRELLSQEARRLAIAPQPAIDDEGRRETDEEATIRALIERTVPADKADEESCRRYFDKNAGRFRSPDIFEAAHILIAVAPGCEDRARLGAERLIAMLRDDPSGFAAVARTASACPSRDQGGALEQFARGQCAPEFEAALDCLKCGEIASEPVRTRFGYHVVRLDRRIEGAGLPFEAVRTRIAAYLTENRQRQAIAGYIGHLAAQARIEGIVLTPESGEGRKS